MTRVHLVELDKNHLPAAAALFAEGLRRLRHRVPLVPQALARESAVIENLEKLLLSGFPGVAAVFEEGLAGYLIGLPIRSLRGTQRGIYSPEWAHGAGGPDRPAIYRAMYRRMSKIWVSAGCFTHSITLLEGDPEARDTWLWSGFGPLVTDAVRSMDPIPSTAPPGISVRRAGPSDSRTIWSLEVSLHRHLASPPIFMPLLQVDSPEEWEERLGDAGRPAWLALRGDEAVGYLKAENKRAGADFVFDRGTLAVDGAYTVELYRGQGIGALLLDAALEWGREAGFERCSVDFECFNDQGREFWVRHFTPVGLTLIRYVDPRIAWAIWDRDTGAMW